MTWFCIRTSTRREKTAEASLRELGFEVYLPCEVRWANQGHERVEKQSPLFVGYLFARLPDGAAWTAEDLDGAKGGEAVHKVMFYERMEEGQSVIVSLIRSKAVDAIREAEAEGKFNRTLKDRPRPKGENPYKVGDRAKVTEGPFAGFVAQVVQLNGADRVKLLVNIFGRETPADLPVKELEAA